MDFENNAPFDPGFTKYIIGFAPQIDLFYQKINSVSNINQKKFQFKAVYPKIIKLLNTQLGFYAGCLFWGSYIKQFENKPIVGNPCISDDYFEEASLFEVNYIREFLEKFKKDCKYYMNLDFVIEEFKLKILENYKEFLRLNKGFTIELTTDTIKLPVKIKKLTKKRLDEAFETIKNVVTTGAFEDFFAISKTLV